MAKLYAATIKKSSPTTTYIPIDVAISGDKRSTLLVKSDQLNIIQEIQQCGERGLDSDKIVLWSKEGKAFSLDSRGTELLYSSEKQAAEEAHTIKKTKFLSGNVDTYVNVSPSKGSVEKLVKSSRVEDVTSGRKSFKELEKAGEGYSNITNLFFESKVLSRADDIAIRVREEFPLSSPEWQRWTNNTIKYNTTSLTQVVSEYFAGHSIGDVGGKLAGYVPKRGFPGTLAPGENFIENNPFSELPRKVMHPWPAMQEFQFHIRMPPNHPMLPPPLLWFGLNEMYSEKFAENQLSLPSTETVGGMMMYPKDAIRIARNHQIGMCYNQEDQLEHGGMIFKTGRKIGFYNPDHGPTVSAEEAKPPIPPELIPITECWLDPHFGLITSEVNERAATTESEQEEMDDEEADRRAAADRLLALMPGIRELSAVAAQEKLEDEEDMELKRLARLKKLANPLDALDEASEEGKELKLPEPEAKQFDRRTLRLQEKLAKGYARDARKVVTYVIETMFDLQDEIATAEKEENSYKRRGRRRGQRKSKSEEEDEEPLIVADVEIEQDDVAATPFLVEGDDSEPGIILP